MILDNIDRKEIAMDDKLKIAGYCRISVDEELDKDNTSIENQKALITDYVTRTFPNAQPIVWHCHAVHWARSGPYSG